MILADRPKQSSPIAAATGDPMTIAAPTPTAAGAAPLERLERLGGLLNFYYRRAA